MLLSTTICKNNTFSRFFSTNHTYCRYKAFRLSILLEKAIKKSLILLS